jgi:hypothetical protein
MDKANKAKKRIHTTILHPLYSQGNKKTVLDAIHNAKKTVKEATGNGVLLNVIIPSSELKSSTTKAMLNIAEIPWIFSPKRLLDNPKAIDDYKKIKELLSELNQIFGKYNG